MLIPFPVMRCRPDAWLYANRAVGGTYRRDYGGENVTHFCVFLSGGNCPISSTTDLSHCSVRCFGHGYSSQPQVVEAPSRTVIDVYESQPKWPEDGLVDLWVRPRNCEEMIAGGETCTYSGITGKTPSYNPQGFTFTYAGSGEVGLLDGPVNTAKFNGPEDLQVDQFGNILVADTQNHAIRMIKYGGGGEVITIAGFSGEPGVKV